MIDLTEKWRPLIHDAVTFRERMNGLSKSVEMEAASDEGIRQQLSELVALRQPSRVLSAAEQTAAIAQHLKGVPADQHGNWVIFPWLRRMVHLLPEAEFVEVRSDRNRNKITREEQSRLAQARIGVVGLSVGLASAVTLALEGIGRHFRLADFDRLGLTNLNRLRAGVHQLGVNKSVIAARQMFELDPYLDIEIFPEGLREDNLDAFLGDGAGKLDLLVEECDDVAIKILVREAARARGIPVVMETSDRGLIDIERFDLEPDRPLLHGRIEGVKAGDLAELAFPDKVALLMRMIDPSTISARAAASMPEVRRTLSTWPQLASGVALGGAVVADTARRILLGELACSGRFFVDLERIITEARAAG